MSYSANSDSDSDSVDVIAQALAEGAKANANANVEGATDATSVIGNTFTENITNAAKDIGAALGATAAKVVTEVASNVASNVAPVAAAATEPDDAVAVSANVSLSEFNDREKIEMGLREFLNSTSLLESYVTEVDKVIQASGVAFIKMLPGEDISGPVVVSYCNPSISGLSDFVPHYNLFLFYESEAELNIAPIHELLNSKVVQREQQLQQLQPSQTDASWRYELKDDTTNRFSLQLRIGSVFNVPVFTVHIMHNVFRTSELPSALAPPVESAPFRYNAKSIGPYTQLDLMLELLMHTDEEDPYAPVNVLVARGMNTLCVKYNPGSESENAVPIRVVCDEFNKFIVSEEARARVTKNALIAVMQNPAVKTKVNDLDMHFFDIFPSGQYGLYFNEDVLRCDTRDATGPIMIQGSPLTRTGIIVAALTAVNAALRASGGAHIVAGGGAAVSYYLQDFVNDARTSVFDDAVIRESGVNMVSLLERCQKIPMNDIDCFVFGNVSRQFLLLLSLYMMVLYENFYGRAKRYRMQDAVAKQEQRMQFVVPSLPDDPIELFMYGIRNTDVNTQLISKRLAKNDKVQVVGQVTECFSQIVHRACVACNEDAYYMQPIDLVKKDIAEFVVLYQISLYDPDNITVPEDMEAMILGQYTADNMVSLKTTMLDIICIFCDEGKSLFIRIFMARKNPKDFARLRVFIDLYLLRLLQSNSDEFIQYKDGLIVDIGDLRVMMDELNTKYYLEQGHIAAIDEGTVSQLDTDRTAFLTLLRSIGRTIVAIPDPLGNVVPFKFQAATGAQTVQVFNDGPGMRYQFDLNAHMHALVAQPMQPMQPMQQWLQTVFQQIRFTLEIEKFFLSRLEKILDPANPDGNRKIAFNDMPVRSPGMLQLYYALKMINFDKEKTKQKKKYGTLRYNLLTPIREFILKQGGVTPSNAYVINIYHKSTVHKDWLTLVKYVLLKDQLADLKLMQIVSDPANYDDAVNEEIGRILLEWNTHAPAKLTGGSTRKRKRVRRWKNAVTKHGNIHRAKKRNATKCNICKRTRRA